MDEDKTDASGSHDINATIESFGEANFGTLVGVLGRLSKWTEEFGRWPTHPQGFGYCKITVKVMSSFCEEKVWAENA